MNSFATIDNSNSVRVLVVDGSVIVRKIIRDMLTEIPGIEVVGVAGDGLYALQQIESLQPDLVTLDTEVPKLDGLAVLQEISRRGHAANVVLLTDDVDGFEQRSQAAREAGAFDLIRKPVPVDSDDCEATGSPYPFRSVLVSRIEAFAQSFRRGDIGPTNNELPRLAATEWQRLQDIEMIAIGVSTGGPSALAKMLTQFPSSFRHPIVIAQHMPADFTRSLAVDLDRSAKAHVQEAAHGMPITAGNIYIAPGGKQTTVVRNAGQLYASVCDDKDASHYRPSVDDLFQSVAACCGCRAIGVILTGMGHDGTEGCRALRACGAPILVQDEATSVVYGMPRSVVAAGLADRSVALEQMANTIQQLVKKEALCV